MRVRSTSVVCAVLLWAGAATAVPDCGQQRHVALAKYAFCQHKALGKLSRGSDFAAYAIANRKCTVKYAATWSKLSAIGVPPCSGGRFVDNGDGTVTDNLSGLQWERKTDDVTIHDEDNSYQSSLTIVDGANGDLFTTFLETLNASPGCFAGQCDWRLPTLMELQSIRALAQSSPYACVGSPCIDEITFGPTQASPYWASALQLNFSSGGISASARTNSYPVRAVRGGL